MRARDLNRNLHARSRQARVNGGQRGSGDDRAGHQIQDHLKPPVRLVANLDGDVAQGTLGADENREVDLPAGQLVSGNEVELQQVRVGRVEDRCFVRRMQLNGKRGPGRGAFESQSVFLRVMNVAARKRSALAGNGGVQQLGNGGEERAGTGTTSFVCELAHRK